MRKTDSHHPIAIIGLVLLIYPGTADSSGDGHDVVQITLPSLGGGSASASEFRGQWLVLNYWVTWCAPCRKKIPGLNELHTARDDVTLLGLAHEDTGSANISFFPEDFDMGYPSSLIDVYDPLDPFGSGKPRQKLNWITTNIVRSFP